MIQYMTSKEAAEKLCEIDRPSIFLTNSIVTFISIAVLLFIGILVTKAFDLTSLSWHIVEFIYICFIGYLFLLEAASIIMIYRSDGKYWESYTYEPCWYDKLSIFQKRLFVLESLNDLSNFSGETVLINGAIISDLFLKYLKRTKSEDGEFYTYSWKFRIEYLGKNCFGLFKSSNDVQKLREKQGNFFLILGEVSGKVIKNARIMDAMIKNMDYDKNYSKNIYYYYY